MSNFKNVILALSMRGLAAFAEGNPVIELPLGTLFSKPRDCVFSAPRQALTEDSLIECERVILRGALVTQGFALRILARELVFEGAGKILAFDGAAAATAAVGPGVPKAATGGDGQRTEESGQPGAEGMRGTKGPDDAALSGHQNPGEIFIYAAQIVGKPVILGVGQKGGKGARGGQGGEGGNGGKGGNADAGFIGIDSDHAGQGGPGGRGGWGGQGGKGGKGGAAVKVSLFSESLKDVDQSQVISAPGDGGEGGDGGPGGPGGNGGPGGEGDSDFLSSIEPGQPGPNGEQGVAGGAGYPGDRGAAAALPSVVDIKNLPPLRKNIERAWQDFHWARYFNLLIEDSVRLILGEQMTREDMALMPNESLVLRNIQKDFAKEVLDAWEVNFVPSIEEAFRSLQTEEIKSKLELSKALTSELRSIESSSGPSKSLLKLRDLSRKAREESSFVLEEAAQKCIAYNKAIAGYLAGPLANPFLSLMSVYAVPVCNKDPDFGKVSELMKPIKLAIKMEERLIPVGLLGSYSAVDAWRAIASDIVVTVIEYKGLDINEVPETLPSRFAMSKNGYKTSLVLPDQHKVTRATLGAYLQMLARQRRAL